MKLSFEQHNGLGKIARYYEKIEPIAENMDDSESVLEEVLRKNMMEVHCSLRQNQMKISDRRQEVFRRFQDRESNSSIVNLNVIINEDRF